MACFLCVFRFLFAWESIKLCLQLFRMLWFLLCFGLLSSDASKQEKIAFSHTRVALFSLWSVSTAISSLGLHSWLGKMGRFPSPCFTERNTEASVRTKGCRLRSHSWKWALLTPSAHLKPGRRGQKGGRWGDTVRKGPGFLGQRSQKPGKGGKREGVTDRSPQL